MAHRGRPALDAVRVERTETSLPVQQREAHGEVRQHEGRSGGPRSSLEQLLGGAPLHLSFFAAMRRLEGVFRRAPRFGESVDLRCAAVSTEASPVRPHRRATRVHEHRRRTGLPGPCSSQRRRDGTDRPSAQRYVLPE